MQAAAAVVEEEKEEEECTLSTIRAAEFFVQPLLKNYHTKLATDDNWCLNLMPFSKRDLQIESSFEEVQLEWMRKEGMDKNEWFFYVLRLFDRLQNT